MFCVQPTMSLMPALVPCQVSQHVQPALGVGWAGVFSWRLLSWPLGRADTHRVDDLP